MGVHFKENEDKITIGMIISGVVIIAILVTSLIVYLININNSKNQEEIAKEEMQTADSQQNEEDDSEVVSIDIGKSVNEAQNELETNNAKKNTTNSLENTASNITNNTTKKSTTSSNKKDDSTNKTKESENTASSTTENTNTKTESSSNEVKFVAPLKGEVIREFAKDSLVYSDTLEEWITHTGVDVKADKTSVVKASAKVTVSAIKNDPRYGLTVIVEHEGGYKSVYANLLTAEFVVEGESVEEGQTIGTVGNSSSFEIADEYHLHFEIIKDGEYLNPVNLVEF